jgi:hypothetical protein
MNLARWTQFGYGSPPPKKVEFSSNFPVHKTDPPYHPPANSAKVRGASGVIVARVTLVAFRGGKRVNRAVAAAATDSGGRGGIQYPDFFHLPADLHLQRPVL